MEMMTYKGKQKREPAVPDRFLFREEKSSPSGIRCCACLLHMHTMHDEDRKAEMGGRRPS